MKASEANKKLCPFMGELTKFGNPSSGDCVTSGCMAWVMTKEHERKTFRDKEHNVELEGIDSTTHKRVKVWGRELPDEEKEGYCLRLDVGVTISNG
jgi:hypothetical protein